MHTNQRLLVFHAFVVYIFIFNFLARAFYGANPPVTKLGKDGPSIITKWLALQLHPILTLGLPWFIEDPLLHTFSLPTFIVKSDYKKLYNFFYESSDPILDQAEKLGIKRDEACHNLLFATCFNTFGGLKIVFPSIVKWVGLAGALMKSVVYEALRIEPPVQFQYGKAKKDLVIESHDASFKVKKGEMLFGYQPFATKDPQVFDNAEPFVLDRFVGDGEKLLKYLLWSNGPETEKPTVDNKQCPGKNFVELVCRLFLVEWFLRYDSFKIEVSTSPLGAAVTITSLVQATAAV